MAELSIELPSNARFDSLESALAGDTFLDVFYGNDLGSGAPAFSDLPLDLPATYSPQGYSSPSHPSDGVSTSEDDSSSLHRPAIKNERPLVEKFDIHSLQEHARKRCLDDKVLVAASASSSSNPPSPLCETDRQQKRQKRLLKNRESAQLSRQRKKMHVDELEAKVAELTTETEYLSRENDHLRKEVNDLRGKLGLPAIELPPRRQTTLSNSKAAKAAGICLLVLLFSFGLVMNAPAGQRLLMRSSGGGTVRTGRALQSLEDSSASAAEQPLGPVVVPVVPAPPVEQHIVQSSTSPSASSSSSSSASDSSKQPSSKRPLIPPANPDSSNHNLAPEDDAHSLVPVAGSKRPRNIRILDDDESASEAVTIPTVKLQRDGSLVPVRDLSTEYQLIRQSRTSRHRPPSQYIYCSEAQQLHLDPQATSDGLPSVVALLIPSEFLNATAAPRNSLVEVTCSVMDMNAYPLYQPSNNSDDGSNAALQRT